MADTIANQPRSGPTTRTPNEDRAGWIFSEINTLAKCVHRMGIMLIGDEGEDPRNIDAYQTAIKALSAQIGLLADMGCVLTHGLDLHKADPRAWLLPPAYEIEDAEGASHG